MELVLEMRSASGNAFFGKSRRLISFKDQTPASASVSVIVVFAYVFCSLLNIFQLALSLTITDYLCTWHVL